MELSTLKKCKSCYWFMLADKARKCCNSASPLVCNRDSEVVCEHWRDQRSKSERFSAFTVSIHPNFTEVHFSVEKQIADAELELQNRLIYFFKDSLGIKMGREEANFILIHRFESFCLAYRKYATSSSHASRDVLIGIADAALQHCAGHQ